MKKLFITMILILSVGVFSCNKPNTSVPDETKVITLPPEGSSVVDANNKFAFQFFQAALEQDAENNNKLISPLSIYMALSMVYNGADNSTRDSIAGTLQLAGVNIDELNNICHTLISSLSGEDNKVQLSIANSIWYRKNIFQPLPSFLNTVQESYNATISPLDFSSPSALLTINSWVAQKTNNKILKIIDDIPSDELMYLINAIYFNGAWKYAFKPAETLNDYFYLQDGSAKSVPFMKQKIKTKMINENSFSMIELPYGGGNSFSMYILKPANNDQSVTQFASSFSEDALEKAINEMDSTSFELQMPKWEYSYSLDDIKPELAKLGMGIAFTPVADFSKMYDPSQIRVNISKAIHKTYIKVNEAGTEAAAVTAIGMGFTSISQPNIFKLDHPFLYAIIEKQTGVILFLGVVNNPGEI